MLCRNANIAKPFSSIYVDDLRWPPIPHTGRSWLDSPRPSAKIDWHTVGQKQQRPSYRENSEPEFNVLARRTLGLECPDVRELPLVLDRDHCESQHFQVFDELIPAGEARSRLDHVKLAIQLECPI